MSIKNCSILLPGTIYFGSESINYLKDIITQEKATNVAILSDETLKKIGITDLIYNVVKDEDIKINEIYNLATESTYNEFYNVYKQVANLQPDLVIAVGGGSVIDQAKLVAAALSNDYFADDIHNTSLLQNESVATVLMPTTAGTGAEATANAILSFPEQELKIGIVHPNLMAKYVILDPNLLSKLPKAVVAATGIDTFCHAMESYISKKSNVFSKFFATKSIELVGKSLKSMYDDINNEQARADMLLASLYGGICLTSSTTVGVHALSYPLGGKYHIPHSIANAILLPHVMQFNLPACISSFSAFYKILNPKHANENDETNAQLFVDYLYDLNEYLCIPKSLTEFGIHKDEIGFIAKQALKVERLITQNPREMEYDDVEKIYSKLFD